jgi:Fic family protein
LSAFFERYRDEYYRRLLEVSQHGKWKEWIVYFLRGIASQARDAIGRSDSLLALWQKYRKDLQEARASALLLQLVDELFSYPAITNHTAAEKLSVTPRSAQLNIEKLERANILREATGKQRNRVYIAPEIISIIEEGEG